MTEETKRITTPFSDEIVESLIAGDRVFITGEVYTARDAAHKCLVELLDKGEKLPFDPHGQVIYFVGPAPAKPGKPIGSAGPTTSYRMNPYAPRMIEEGLKGMIGKCSGFVRMVCVSVSYVPIVTLSRLVSVKTSASSCSA